MGESVPPSNQDLRPPPAQVALEGLPDDSVSVGLAVMSRLDNYNRWVYEVIRRYLGATILEVGSGLGNITRFLLSARRVVCLEPFGPYREYFARQFAEHANVHLLPYRIEQCPNGDLPAGSFDSVVCLNVLEHIADDVGALRRMRELLNPGGSAVVLAPALPWLYGEWDRALGHWRRYTLTSLRRAFHAAGLRPVRGRYLNFLGAFGWWYQSRVLRRRKIGAQSAGLFNRLVPVLAAMERLIPAPLGQSVLVVGRA